MAHPHAYPWHDGHTKHHPGVAGTGGVLVSGEPKEELVPKDRSPATYEQLLHPWGQIGGGQGSLRAYPYHDHRRQIEELVDQHKFVIDLAGSSRPKIDLSRLNYDTQHLTVHDPAPDHQKGTSDWDYTFGWRAIHELAHALTLPEVNKVYGEGRRVGRLGQRTRGESLRAVHWEWLAAHKQRELSEQLGIRIPDQAFNRELNTIMHEAVSRVVTGDVTDPGMKGFVPHSHGISLGVGSDIIGDQGRNLGLVGNSDSLAKGEGVGTVAARMNFEPDIAQALAKSLRERIDEYKDELVNLRKRELGRNFVSGSGSGRLSVSPLRKDEDPRLNIPGHVKKHPIFTGTNTVTLMTAERPFFSAEVEGENEALMEELRRSNVEFEGPIEGSYGGKENSFWVYGLAREQAFDLGKRFGQESVVFADGGKQEMLYTNGPNAGKYNPALPTWEWFPDEEKPEDYYTQMAQGGFLRLHFDWDEYRDSPVSQTKPQSPEQDTQPTPTQKSERRMRKAMGGLGGGPIGGRTAGGSVGEIAGEGAPIGLSEKGAGKSKVKTRKALSSSEHEGKVGMRSLSDIRGKVFKKSEDWIDLEHPNERDKRLKNKGQAGKMPSDSKSQELTKEGKGSGGEVSKGKAKGKKPSDSGSKGGGMSADSLIAKAKKGKGPSGKPHEEPGKIPDGEDETCNEEGIGGQTSSGRKVGSYSPTSKEAKGGGYTNLDEILEAKHTRPAEISKKPVGGGSVTKDASQHPVDEKAIGGSRKSGSAKGRYAEPKRRGDGSFATPESVKSGGRRSDPPPHPERGLGRVQSGQSKTVNPEGSGGQISRGVRKSAIEELYQLRQLRKADGTPTAKPPGGAPTPSAPPTSAPKAPEASGAPTAPGAPGGAPKAPGGAPKPPGLGKAASSEASPQRGPKALMERIKKCGEISKCGDMKKGLDIGTKQGAALQGAHDAAKKPAEKQPARIRDSSVAGPTPKGVGAGTDTQKVPGLQTGGSQYHADRLHGMRGKAGLGKPPAADPGGFGGALQTGASQFGKKEKK